MISVNCGGVNKRILLAFAPRCRGGRRGAGRRRQQYPPKPLTLPRRVECDFKERKYRTRKHQLTNYAGVYANALFTPSQRRPPRTNLAPAIHGIRSDTCGPMNNGTASPQETALPLHECMPQQVKKTTLQKKKKERKAVIVPYRETFL